MSGTSKKILASATIAATVLLGLLYPPPVEASSNRDLPSGSGSPVADASHEQALTLSKAVDSDRLMEIVEDRSEVIIGYRYENPGVAGEFLPTASRSLDSFVSTFEEKYLTGPRFVGLIVQPESGKRGTEVDGTIDVSGEPYNPDPVDLTSTYDAAAVIADANATAAEEHSGSLRRTDSPTEWYPGTVTVDIQRDQTLNRTLITQFVDWGSVAPGDVIPNGYGIEVAVDAYNYRDLDAKRIRPLDCIPSNYNEFFFADNHALSWEVVGTPGIETLAYDDSDAGDECGRQGFAVGVPFVRGMDPDENGRYAMLVSIDAPAPEHDDFAPEASQIQADLQLVNDAACRVLPLLPLAICMGWTSFDLLGVEASRAVLSRDRGMFAPDRCWISEVDETALGTLMTPMQHCGQPSALSGLDATSIEVSPLTATGRSVSISHIPFTALPVGATIAPFVQSRFPYLVAPTRPVTTQVVYPNEGDPGVTKQNEHWTGIRDLRAWIGSTEIAVTDGWKSWELAIPASGDSITLSNSSDNVIFGNGSISVLRALAHDGTISFRVGDGQPNYIKLDDLEESVDPWQYVGDVPIREVSREKFVTAWPGGSCYTYICQQQVGFEYTTDAAATRAHMNAIGAWDGYVEFKCAPGGNEAYSLRRVLWRNGDGIAFDYNTRMGCDYTQGIDAPNDIEWRFFWAGYSGPKYLSGEQFSADTLVPQ